MSENKDIHNIANRITNTHNKISDACNLSARPTTEIKLMAVSKTKPIDAVMEAYEAGQRIFGENYAQELYEKSQILAHLTEIEWHYIGPIQSNKTKIIAQSCQWIDSLERLKIAQRLNNHAAEFDKTLNILIQVNISRSEAKSGVLLEDVESLAAEIVNLPNLNFRGLMAIPDQHEQVEQLKSEFNQMHTCYLMLQQQYPNVDTLSLGMSQDLITAIECGSTMVRIGTDIFGARG